MTKLVTTETIIIGHLPQAYGKVRSQDKLRLYDRCSGWSPLQNMLAELLTANTYVFLAGTFYGFQSLLYSDLQQEKERGVNTPRAGLSQWLMGIGCLNTQLPLTFEEITLRYVTTSVAVGIVSHGNYFAK